MGLEKGNYHVHTTMSDGALAPEEVIKLAIAQGLDEIGICDHFYTKKARNSVDDVKAYAARINGLKAQFADKIRVLSGIEIDTSWKNNRRSKLPYKKLNELDFVLFEYVEDNEVREICPARDFKACYSIADVVKARKDLTRHVGLAHPNVLRMDISPEELAKALADNDIYIDCSVGWRHTDDFPFAIRYVGNFGDQFREKGIAFAPGTDFHMTEGLDTQHAYQEIKRHNLKLKVFE